MSDDIRYVRRQQNRDPVAPFIQSDYDECLWRLNDLIINMSGSTRLLSDFNIPLPVTERILENQIENYQLYFETNYNRDEQREIAEINIGTLNTDQQIVYNEIMAAVDSVTRNIQPPKNVFFIKAPGGTGKTFVFNTILAKLRSEGKVAVASASSGVAALLLVGGNTAHKKLRLPIKLHQHSFCMFSEKSNTWQMLKQAAIIIWDEAPMTTRYAFEALNRTMQKLMRNDLPFGGKVVAFGGDFRQVLPVIPKGKREQIVNVILHRSTLWQHVQILNLNINERVLRQGNTLSARSFCEFLLNIGDVH
jgi:hypothetical protein